MTEEFRHECECRHWLRATGGNTAKLKVIMLQIEKKRGKPAADRLRRDIWHMLKNSGHSIKTEMVNRDGKRFARYTMEVE